MLNRARELWEGLGRNNQIILAASSLGVLVALIGFIAWASTPEYVPLFSNLSAQDANSITDKLNEAGIPFRRQQGGTAIEVPAQSRDEMRMKLISQGLPQQTSGTLGYELLEKTNNFQTQPMEAMTMQRAREGEVSKSIMSFQQVASATVHFAPADDSPFAATKHDATASVLVMLKPGQNLSDENVQSVLRVTQMSFPNLMEKGISIVDSQGDLLFDGTRSGAMEGDGRIKQQRALAQAKRTELQSLLDNTIGPHKAVVIVNPELNFDQEDVQTSTTEAGAVTATSSQTEELNGQGTTKGGSPGANANTAGAPNNSPLANLGAAGVPTYATTNDSNGHYKNETVTKTSEPSHVIKHIVKAPGRIEKLTVSALVDSKVPPEQVASIQKTLETAIAVDPTDTTASRRVSVAQVPFDRTAEDAETKAAAIARGAENSARLISIAVPLALMMVCFFLLARALKKPAPLVRGGQLALAGAGAGFGGSGGPGMTLALAADGTPIPGQTIGAALDEESGPIGLSSGGEPRTFAVIEEAFDSNLESILHMAHSKPETVAQLVKGWIVDEKP